MHDSKTLQNPTSTSDVVPASVLLAARARNVLVTQGQEQGDPVYVLLREWVQNPTSTSAAVEARKRLKTTGIRPYSLKKREAGEEARAEAGEEARAEDADDKRDNNDENDDDSNNERAQAIKTELEAIAVPDVDDTTTEPTLDTHMPRWKAIGRKIRLEGAYEKAIGMDRLRRRLASMKQ